MQHKKSGKKRKIIVSAIVAFLFVSIVSIAIVQNQYGRTTSELLPANLQALIKALQEAQNAKKLQSATKSAAQVNQVTSATTGLVSTTPVTTSPKLSKSVSTTGLRDAFGFNTERFVMTIEEQADADTLRSSGLRLVKEMNPTVLRFPGGNIGNVYHPTGNGYGYIRSEIPNNSFYNPPYNWSQTGATKNLMYYFMDQAKAVGVTDILYVANLYTGTPEEAIFVIDEFTKNGFTIVGIELGNELFFQPWNQKIKTVEQYIEIANQFITPIKEKYPRIPLAVLAREYTGELNENIRKGFPIINNWNTAIASMKNIDGIILHTYGNARVCSALNNLERTFDCAKNATQFEYFDWAGQTDEYFSKFTNKNIWFTEFNIEPSGERIGNTFLHAAKVYEILFQTLTPALAERLDFVIHHNLLATGTAMSAVYRSSESDTMRKSAQAYVLEMYKNVIDNTSGLSSTTTIESADIDLSKRDTKKDFIYRILDTRNGVIVMFANMSGKDIAFSVKNNETLLTSEVNQEVIGGPDLWSSFDSNPAYRNSGKNWAVSELKETSVSVKDGLVSVPKYHLGWIEFKK